MTDRDFWMRLRASKIEQAKALAEQRAAVIAEYKAIERFLDLPAEPQPIHETKTATVTERLTYSV